MRVLVVTNKFPVRSETFIREHVLGCAKRGCHVTVVSGGVGHGIGEDELREIHDFNIQLVTVRGYRGELGAKLFQLLRDCIRTPAFIREALFRKFFSRRDMIRAYPFMREIRKISSDVVHIHYGVWGAKLHRLGLPKNSIITWHGYDANLIPGLVGESVYKELFSDTYQHTVGSEFMRDRLISLGADSRQISKIPMGIDLNKFVPPQKSRNLSTPLRLLSVGRLHKMKGHTYLIHAVKHVIEMGKEVQLRIIGEGQERTALEEQINRLSLNRYVTLVGAKGSGEIIKEMHWANVFALTSIQTDEGLVETQGVVFAEAQATGLPVIGSDVGGISESLIHNRTGILCPSKDPKAIADAICFFINNPQAIADYGINARRFVEEQFDVEVMLDRFAQLYESVTEN